MSGVREGRGGRGVKGVKEGRGGGGGREVRAGDPLPSQCQPQRGRRDTSDDNEHTHCLSTTAILVYVLQYEHSVHHVYCIDTAT